MHVIYEDIKGANKDAKVLMLEGLQPCTIFFFFFALMYRSSVRIKELLCFVLSQGPKSKKKDVQQIILLGFITIPLALLTLSRVPISQGLFKFSVMLI